MLDLRQLSAPRHVPWWLCVLGLVAIWSTTLRDLCMTIWSTEEQSQGPIVLGICVWLIPKASLHASTTRRSASLALSPAVLFADAMLFVFDVPSVS